MSLMKCLKLEYTKHCFGGLIMEITKLQRMPGLQLSRKRRKKLYGTVVRIKSYHFAKHIIGVLTYTKMLHAFALLCHSWK